MSDEKVPFHNPFAALGGLRDRLPAPTAAGREAGAPALAPAPTPPRPTGKTWPRAVVRLERTGRGGKEATVIEKLDLSAAEREAWLKALKAALGCGGSLDGASLVLQGDQRDRVKILLTQRGVKKVTVA